MPFSKPDLDHRSFEFLLKDAIETAHRACPQWTDRSANDPMMALIEASAFLTDLMIYRTNRMPEKAYSALLDLIGAQISPPSAAVAELIFKREDDESGEFEIPAGTVLATTSGDVSFVLPQSVKLFEGEAEAQGTALHASLYHGELLGTSTGQPGQFFRLANSPVIAETGDHLDVLIGVETQPGDIPSGARTREFEGKVFHLWEDVKAFANRVHDEAVFICNRQEGTIIFAPALNDVPQADDNSRIPVTETIATLGSIPPPGREIRAWYRSGGGVLGNVAAHTLTRLDGFPGISVTNPYRATGGRNSESMEAAMQRGPLALMEVETAVTARDFEYAALNTRVAARARAFTRAQTWRHAEPGTVEIQIVPYVDEAKPASERSRLHTLLNHQSIDLLQRVGDVVSRCAPLGVQTVPNWTRLRQVTVDLRAVCFREEDANAVAERLSNNVYTQISPFAKRSFGQPLRASDLYELVSVEPGIRYVERLRFLVDEAPYKDCRHLSADVFQPRTWHVCSASSVFRSVDDGQSWCKTLKFEGDELPTLCVAHPYCRGWIVVVSSRGEAGSAVHLSKDCGETWQRDIAVFGFQTNDLAWAARDNDPQLFLATSKGLYVFRPLANDAPERITVLEGDNEFGFRAVAAAPPINGNETIAVAAGNRMGVWMSNAYGQSRSFRLCGEDGLRNSDVRILEAHSRGGRSFLWAGFAAEGGVEGEGCARLELRGEADDPDGWQMVSQGWKGGSCECVSFGKDDVFAGSNRGGVLTIPYGRLDQGWASGQIDNGLPLRDEQRLHHEIEGVAVRQTTDGELSVLAGGPRGAFKSTDKLASFQDAARIELEDYIALPEGWLFASGEHKIEIISEEAAREDTR